VLQVPAAHGAFMGVEHVAAQGVDAFALVELVGDFAAVVLSGQISGGIDRAAQCPVFLQGGGEGVLPVGAGQFPHDQRGGDVPVFQLAASHRISSQFSAMSWVLTRRVSRGPTSG